MRTTPHGKHSLVHGLSFAGSAGSAVKLFQVQIGASSCRAKESSLFSHVYCAWHVPLVFSFESLGFDSKACVILCALVLQEIVIAHTRT